MLRPSGSELTRILHASRLVPMPIRRSAKAGLRPTAASTRSALSRRLTRIRDLAHDLGLDSGARPRNVVGDACHRGRDRTRGGRRAPRAEVQGLAASARSNSKRPTNRPKAAAIAGRGPRSMLTPPAPLRAPDGCVRGNNLESRGHGGPILHVLPLRPGASDASRDACNGGRTRRPCLGHRRNRRPPRRIPRIYLCASSGCA